MPFKHWPTQKSASTNEGPWAPVLLNFEAMIDKFVKDLARQTDLPKAELDDFVEHVTLVLKDWFIHLFVRNAADVSLLLQEGRQYAGIFHERLKKLDLAPKPLREIVLGTDFDPLLQLLNARRWLSDSTANTRAIFDALFGVLASNSIIEPGDNIFESDDDAPKRGRPRGISEYPELHRLIFFLTTYTARHGVLLSTYMKTNEKTRVAAGSLIDTLNTLREYLAQELEWKWLTEFLPRSDQHERHVATYRRLASAAMAKATQPET